MTATTECAGGNTGAGDRAQLAVFAAVAAALAVLLYYPTFEWLYERFVAPESYYSHGFLIPAIVVYLIWLKKSELRSIPVSGNRAGLALAVGALLVHLVVLLAGVHSLSSYTLLPLLFGASLYLFGGSVTRRIAFPLSFIGFMLPLPLAAINAVSFPVRMFATEMSVLLMKLPQYPVSSEGFRIVFPHGSAIVGAPCSGLRSLITMFALGSLFAYLMKAKAHRKIMVVASSVILALASNIARVVTLSLGTYYIGWEKVQGTFHDVSGYAIFIGTFAALWLVKRTLEETR